MNNETLNHFASVPYGIGLNRSRFNRSKKHSTSLNAGLLYPIYCSEVLPGDTVKLDVSSLVRMSTPFVPVMDEAFVDVQAYFVPNRLIWERWEEFCGENKSGHWAQPVTYTIPQINAPSSGGDGITNSSVKGWAKGSIADYLGIPIHVGDISVNALPFRAYCKIWNDWWRDENLQDPANFYLDSVTRTGNNAGVIRTSAEVSAGTPFFLGTSFLSFMDNSGYVNDAWKGGSPLPVCKFHGYFTSALPSPQKSLSPAGISLTGLVPVGNSVDFTGSAWSSATAFQPKFSPGNSSLTIDSNDKLLYRRGGSSYEGKTYMAGGTHGVDVDPAWLDLRADLSQASMVTINALREAFAVQRYFEKMARGGSRYIEIVKSFFGVTSPDGRMQRSEFLGGKRIPVNMTQVAQTAQSSGSTSGVGLLGAFSQTIDNADLFTHSFVEHGYLMVVACIRTDRTYQQGIPKMFSRQKFTDFYLPTFANLGELPILTKEIYATGVASDDDSVFGYQEAWAEYRYEQNQISGELRSTYATPLDQWHYADYYTAKPTLSSAWIREPQVNVERTLAVADQDQFIGDFRINGVWSRVMPLYSIPGLIDHH